MLSVSLPPPIAAQLNELVYRTNCTKTFHVLRALYKYMEVSLERALVISSYEKYLASGERELPPADVLRVIEGGSESK